MFKAIDVGLTVLTSPVVALGVAYELVRCAFLRGRVLVAQLGDAIEARR